MAESIDFQYPMKKSCGEAIKLFCKDVPHGHARVMRCLQEHLDDAKMPPPCKAEVGNSTARSAQDYRCARVRGFAAGAVTCGGSFPRAMGEASLPCTCFGV